MSDWADLTLAAAAEGLRRGRFSATELASAALGEIDRTGPVLNDFITITREEALRQAGESDERIGRGRPRSQLDGIPIALKDVFLTRGVRTTCGSRILGNFMPPYDGTAVQRLRDAGAVLVGKTNLDEFAMGSSNENSAFGPCRNPWNPERVPGGSSGGSAVAVAARHCLGALGTDTGGSIRLPASYCSVVGVKPTYGRVSRYGIVAYASSLDQVGPFALDVRDAAILLEAIAGHDPLDSTSSPRPVPPLQDVLEGGVRGLRVGVPREYFAEGLQPEVEASVRAAIRGLEASGATAEPVSLPHAGHALATYYVLATAEASSNLARYDGVRYGDRARDATTLVEAYCRTRERGFGAEVKRRILLGTFALSAGYYDAYYGKAQRVRTLIRRDFDHAFASCDVIAAPTAPTTAFAIGAKMDDPLTMYLTDVLTLSVNLAGLPGLSVPCGADAAGLPIGLQLIGRPFAEDLLLRVAFAHEQSSGWRARVPPVVEVRA
ncbi:MAG: aspartyl-tRNA(Asn)/glutamyl-tRNA(Gln) amidotransferase subunit [Candidatus Binatota bacterium]|nr:aspartyl-tRNA(Asn)/glutamyl-tRNA(Gln) amidotransferase subunit [Candidatus Binatota bacterium]